MGKPRLAGHMRILISSIMCGSRKFVVWASFSYITINIKGKWQHFKVLSLFTVHKLPFAALFHSALAPFLSCLPFFLTASSRMLFTFLSIYHCDDMLAVRASLGHLKRPGKRELWWSSGRPNKLVVDFWNAQEKYEGEIVGVLKRMCFLPYTNMPTPNLKSWHD